jgi:hypothetical protein
MPEKKIAAIMARTKTIAVVIKTSRRVGQTTFVISARVCWMN